MKQILAATSPVHNRGRQSIYKSLEAMWIVGTKATSSAKRVPERETTN
jgi:hypothetical protein